MAIRTVMTDLTPMHAALTNARLELFEAAAKLPEEERLTWARGILTKWAQSQPLAARQFLYGLDRQVDEELARRGESIATATRNAGL